jgi:hypothetical protein
MSGEIDPGWRRRGRVVSSFVRKREIAVSANSVPDSSSIVPAPTISMADPTARRTPVSHAARGLVRVLMDQAEADAARIEQAVRSIPVAWMDGTRWKGTKGSKRAIERIRARMPRPPDLLQPRVVLWRYLCPLSEIPDAGDEPAQPCIAVKVVIARYETPPLGPALLGLIVTAHALGRMFDRGGFDLDAGAAIFDAHTCALMRISVTTSRSAYQPKP